MLRWSHWLLSYGSAYLRSFQDLRPLRQKVNVLPLGSGALAGNPFNVDRNFLAKELKFDSISLNSLDATGNRDFVSTFTLLIKLLHVCVTDFRFFRPDIVLVLAVGMHIESNGRRPDIVFDAGVWIC